MPLLQATRFCASLLFNLNLFMSSCTHSCQVFLPLPLPLTPSTTKLLHADTQSVGSLRSTCPYHLSLPRLTTSEIPSMPKRLNNSSLLFLSRSVTPHINLTIILLYVQVFAYLLLSLPMSRCHTSKHFVHKPCKSFLSASVKHLLWLKEGEVR